MTIDKFASARRSGVVLARRVLTASAMFALTTATALGCTTTLHGEASKDTRTPGAKNSDLNPGNYPTTPRPALGAAGGQGKYVEARRMADFVVMPFQVDPGLTNGGGMGNGIVKSGSALGTYLDVTIPESVERSFVVGFSVLRDNEGTQQTSLQNLVLRFNTPEDAATAADDLATKSEKTSGFGDDSSITTKPATLPRYAGTGAYTWENYGSTKILAYTAHGPYVLAQLTISLDGQEAAAELAAATLDKQIPMIDGFKPTPIDKLAELPLDPDGLMARTLEPPEGSRTLLKYGVYGPHGFLAYSTDPAGDEKLFDEAGVTTIVLYDSDVYAARDAAGAKTVVEGFAKDVSTRAEPIDGVPGLSESKCFKEETKPGSEYSTTYYQCLATADRYAIEVHARQKAAAHQKTAAQYLLLTAN